MKKISIKVLFGFFVMIFFSASAYPWGSATHVYIACQTKILLGQQPGLNEMYGSVAPDVFDYMFGIPWAGFMHDLTHGEPSSEPFLSILDQAKGPFKKALGWGFLTHNNAWNADWTAHYSAALNPGEGYVVTKAIQLMYTPDVDAIFIAMFDSLPLTDEQKLFIKLEFCHNIVEAAGDIKLKEIDTQIGQKLYSAARKRSPSFSAMLGNTYADDLSAFSGMNYDEAKAAIMSTEKDFRNIMLLDGMIIIQETSQAIQATAEQFAELAVAYLASYGITLDPTIVDLLPYYAEIVISISYAQLDDFGAEINATAVLVATNMAPYDY